MNAPTIHHDRTPHARRTRREPPCTAHGAAPLLRFDARPDLSAPALIRYWRGW